jgi:hypothetical protein
VFVRSCGVEHFLLGEGFAVNEGLGFSPSACSPSTQAAAVSGARFAVSAVNGVPSANIRCSKRGPHADLLQMKVHGLGIGARQDERRTFVAGRADGTEEIGRRIALIFRLTRPRTAFRPLIDEAVLLADAGSSYMRVRSSTALLHALLRAWSAETT